MHFCSVRIGSLSHTEIPGSFVVNLPLMATVTEIQKIQPNDRSTTSLTMFWSWADDKAQVINVFTGKCEFLTPCMLSKQCLFARFLTVWSKLRGEKPVYPTSLADKKEEIENRSTLVSDITYFHAKQYSESYQQAKDILFSHLKPICGSWVKKPVELEQFTQRF